MDTAKDLMKVIDLNRNSISSHLQRFEENEVDILHRYYSTSFKVYNYIDFIKAAFHQINIVKPYEAKLDNKFLNLYKSIENKEWSIEINDKWVEEVSPIIHLYLQLKTILKAMTLCPSDLADGIIDSNTALVLELYGLR